MTDRPDAKNPFDSPAELTEQSDPAATSRRIEMDDLSADCRGNLTLTSKVIKIASVVFGLGSLGSVIQVIVAFRFFGFPDGWGWWHTLLAFRALYTPCGLLLAWLMWRYAKSLDAMSIQGATAIEAAVEHQAKAWLAAGLLLFLMLIGMAISLSGTLSQIPQ